MGRVKTPGGRITELETPPNIDVVGILLDNGQTIWCERGSYAEYRPIDTEGPGFYFLVPSELKTVEMFGFTRNIVATYYHRY